MPVSLETRALTILGELLGLGDLQEFCAAMMVVLREAVPAEWCALNEVPFDIPGAVTMTDPPVPLHLYEPFARYADENPIAAHFMSTGDGRATRFSDLVTREQLHRLKLYEAVYRPLAVEYQIAFTLPADQGRFLGVVLSRANHDFSDDERDLLNLVRPYLIELYRGVTARLGPGAGRNTALERLLPLPPLCALGLSRRQAEVLRLIATGRTASEAAGTLGISARTAQKHLENCYRTLGVHTRSQAAAAAWQAVV